MTDVNLCVVDKDGKVLRLGGEYDEGTELTSLAISRGAGKNTFAEEYTESQTPPTAIIVPGATQKVCVASVYVVGAGTTGLVSLDFTVPAVKVYRHYMTKYNRSFATDMHRERGAGRSLILTTTTDTDAVFIIINYRLVS